jgi:hypothetical protein
MLAIASVMLMASATGATAVGPPTLFFKFPDGVRGGFGKIQGTGEAPARSSMDWLVKQISECGLPDARSGPPVSHLYTVMGTSGPNDRDIALCVQRTVPYHFSVLDKSGQPIFPDLWSSENRDK